MSRLRLFAALALALTSAAILLAQGPMELYQKGLVEERATGDLRLDLFEYSARSVFVPPISPATNMVITEPQTRGVRRTDNALHSQLHWNPSGYGPRSRNPCLPTDFRRAIGT